MAELEQLAADALVVPEWVLPGQPQHQLPALVRKRRPAGTTAAAKRRDDGRAPGASQGWWPAAPGAEHRPKASGRGQLGSGGRTSASEVVARFVGGRSAHGGGREVRDRDRRLCGRAG